MLYEKKKAKAPSSTGGSSSEFQSLKRPDTSSALASLKKERKTEREKMTRKPAARINWGSCIC